MKIIWDEAGAHLFKMGLDHGVFYPFKDGEYRDGVAWNGLTGVTPEDSGSELTSLYTGDHRSDVAFGQEEYGGSISCLTYPVEMDSCIGTTKLAPGITAYNQNREKFGFSYRVRTGNDVDRKEAGYEIHLIYGAYVKTVSTDHATMSADSEPESIRINYICVAEDTEDLNAIAHVVVHSDELDEASLKRLESILYGTVYTSPRMPLPNELIDRGTITGNVIVTDPAAPTRVPVTLFANGVEEETVEVEIPAASVEYMFTDLPVYDDNGNEIEYTIGTPSAELFEKEEDVDKTVYVREGPVEVIGPSGSLSITANGIYDVETYKDAVVNVPVGVFPSGSNNITSNGTYDVETYKDAVVNVPVGVFPSGSKSITSNGTYDVETYKDAVVNVPVGVFPSGSKSITSNGTYDVETYKDAVVNVKSYEDVLKRVIDRTVGKVPAYANDYLALAELEISKIEAHAFAMCPHLQSVSFPVVSFIGARAFYYCTSLQSVSFPLVSYISGFAFQDCTSLQSVSFPLVSYIGTNAFQLCTSLQTVSFPVVKYIGDYAFDECGLQTVSISNITGIGEATFSRCTSLQTASFPDVIDIGAFAFSRCSSLQSVSFPAAISIHSNAFAYCSSLQSVSFPCVSYIDNYAFQNCTSLQTVSFPAVTSLMSSVFYFCTSLQSVSFPVVKYIGNFAFYNCVPLQSVSFPAATVIGISAFVSCRSLSAIYLLGSSICSLSNRNAFTGTPMSNSTLTGSFGSIFVPASLLTGYQSANNWSYYSSRFVGV